MTRPIRMASGTRASPNGAVPGPLVLISKTFQFTFTEPGTYSYFCTPHPWMRGTVTVTE